jgi:regulation of enolase protein 1 (concanavalin A-like superfamily)
MFKECRWHNEPKSWRTNESSMQMTTDKSTDFWRETHYGFTRDSGHFFGFETKGDFTAQLRVRAEYSEQYDQAGLMVRVDEARWVKAGIELCDDRPCLGSVLTVNQSDWATNLFEGSPKDFWIRATVAKGVLRLQASVDGRIWPILRLAPFPVADRYVVGPMACTPARSGLAIEFSNFEVNPAAAKDLHDLT